MARLTGREIELFRELVRNQYETEKPRLGVGHAAIDNAVHAVANSLSFAIDPKDMENALDQINESLPELKNEN